jgi:hypothetical protein
MPNRVLADLVPGEVEEEAGPELQVLAAGEPDGQPDQLQRGVDEGQQPDRDDVPSNPTILQTQTNYYSSRRNPHGRRRRRGPD